MNGLTRAVCALSLLGGLAGCSSMNSVHWVYPGPGKSRVFSTDAFQRHLVMVSDSDGKIRACSEASPDAMSVFSSSLTGRGIFGPSEKEIEAAAAYGQTAATIERTQTVNMLREWMYRTCELWLSGAIPQGEFLTRSARDHRSMIAILGVEQLTGVVKPPATIISGPAVSAALAQGEKTVELLEAYRKDRETAETAEKTAAAEFTAANLDHDDGAGGKKKLCAFDAAPAGAEADYTKCKTAETNAASAKTVADAARGREKQVLDQLAGLSGGLAAAVSAGTNNAGGLGSGQSRMSDTALATIGATVEKIALTAGVDEALMFCVSYLRGLVTDAGTRTTCNNVVAASATRDNALFGRAFTFSNPDVVSAAAAAQLSQYDQFRATIAGLIIATPAANWAARWNAFQTRTGDQSVTCGTQSLCQSQFTGRVGNPMLVGFGLKPDVYADALKEWQDALKAGGN